MSSLIDIRTPAATSPLPLSPPVEDRDMSAPPEPAHSRFGGSSAERTLHCSASIMRIESVPAHLHKSSSYALRGSVCHAAMGWLIDETEDAESLVGKTIDGYTITRDDVENTLLPAYAHVERLLNTLGAEFYFEQRVVFPTVPGAFGTLDLLIRIGDTIHVIDFKFGSGIRVCALYADGDDDVINPQLLFYAAAARHSLREFFADVKHVVLTILQPQSIEPDAEMVSSVAITHGELDEFIAVYRAACEEALSPAPRLQRGVWCRFCAAKPVCPEHTKPLLDFALFALPTAAPPAPDAAYLQLLADGLNLVDAVKDIRAALHDQAKLALENGYAVPGYVLSAGRAERHWRDDEPTAIAALQKLGLDRDDIVAETMRSPKQVELRAKARGLKVPQELIASSRSGVSLVREENARAPVPGRDEIMRAFSAALQRLQGGGNT
jgi:Protein of unknown function (DUF2800)